MEDAVTAVRTRNRRRAAMIIMVVVGVGSAVLAVVNGVGHRWVGMTGNLLVAIAMAASLFAQRRLGRQRAGRSRPS